ncbi:hypothetical protein B566_EDAN010546, partial [Ephemera danica]
MYSLVVAVVLIVEIIFGMLTLLHHGQIENMVQKELKDLMLEKNGTMLNELQD